MEPTEISDNLWDEVAKYPDVYFLKVVVPFVLLISSNLQFQGDVLNSADLQKAGAAVAHSIILLSPWVESEKFDFLFSYSWQLFNCAQSRKKSKKGDTPNIPYISVMKVDSRTLQD